MNLQLGISDRLAEASNGVTMVVFSVIIVLLVMFLTRYIRLIGFWNAYAYPEFKAAWAALILFIGLDVRTFVFWALRHTDNIDVDFPAAALALVPLVLIAATVMIVIGGLCWIRTTMPTRCPRWLWLVIGIAALSFGFGMAYAA